MENKETKKTDLDKLKEFPSRLRDAFYENAAIKVRIFNKAGRNFFLDLIKNGDEKINAELLSYVFLDEKGEQHYTVAYFLSDECFDCEPIELLEIWKKCQAGTYKKKFQMSD
jgi:hypothetical protein